MYVYSAVVVIWILSHLWVVWTWDLNTGRLQLCPGEEDPPSIFADVGDNITLTICVISDGDLTLEQVYCIDGRCSCHHCFLPKEQFSFTVEPTDSGHRDYYDVTINIYNIQEDFFGILSFMFYSENQQLEVLMLFARKESEDDSLIIYKAWASTVVVALILVTIFILYLNLRKLCSPSSASHDETEIKEQLPSSSYVNHLYDSL